MIIIRYLVRETFKSQFAILFILLLIFFCQKLVRVLGAAVDGDIPTNLVLSLLGLGIPEMAQLILPLSLFLGLLMTLGKLYTDSEITVMHACGLGKRSLVIAAMVLALFTSVFAGFNAIWLSPWSSKHQDAVLAEAKANPSMAAMVEGQFQQAQNGNAVLFVGNVKGKEFHNVFLAQLRPSGNQRPSVVVADKGHRLQRPDGSQVVTLDQGTRYEATFLSRVISWDYQDLLLEHEPAVAQGLSALFDADLAQAIQNRAPVKLDPTVERSLLRRQAAELGQALGYSFDPKQQTWFAQ